MKKFENERRLPMKKLLLYLEKKLRRNPIGYIGIFLFLFGLVGSFEILGTRWE